MRDCRKSGGATVKQGAFLSESVECRANNVKSDSDRNPNPYTVFNQRDAARYEHTCDEGGTTDDGIGVWPRRFITEG